MSSLWGAAVAGTSFHSLVDAFRAHSWPFGGSGSGLDRPAYEPGCPGGGMARLYISCCFIVRFTVADGGRLLFLSGRGGAVRGIPPK